MDILCGAKCSATAIRSARSSVRYVVSTASFTIQHSDDNDNDDTGNYCRLAEYHADLCCVLLHSSSLPTSSHHATILLSPSVCVSLSRSYSRCRLLSFWCTSLGAGLMFSDTTVVMREFIHRIIVTVLLIFIHHLWWTNENIQKWTDRQREDNKLYKITQKYLFICTRAKFEFKN